MISDVSRHFNTAQTIALTALLTLSGAACAQNTSGFIDCALVANVLPSSMSDLSEENGRVWFVSKEAVAQRGKEQKKLPIVSANRHELLQQGSRFLTRLPRTWDTTLAQNQNFYIVRSKVIRSNQQRQPFGQVMRIIGVANMTADGVEVEMQSGAVDVVRALIIVKSITEVTEQDFLLPKVCWPKSPAVEAVPPQVTPHESAQVLAFLSEHYIAAKDAFVLMNKGARAGVALKQTWLLMDELPNQPASMKSFGSAQVMQVFDDMSLLQIKESTHEVRVNTALRFAPKP